MFDSFQLEVTSQRLCCHVVAAVAACDSAETRRRWSFSVLFSPTAVFDGWKSRSVRCRRAAHRMRRGGRLGLGDGIHHRHPRPRWALPFVPFWVANRRGFALKPSLSETIVWCILEICSPATSVQSSPNFAVLLARVATGFFPAGKPPFGRGTEWNPFLGFIWGPKRW